jgi:hypothetical protein
MSNPNTPFFNDITMNYIELSTNSSYGYQQIEQPISFRLFDYVSLKEVEITMLKNRSYDHTRRSTVTSIVINNFSLNFSKCINSFLFYFFLT